MGKIGFVIDNTTIIKPEEFDNLNVASIFNLKTFTSDEKFQDNDFKTNEDFYSYLKEHNQFGKTSTASVGSIKKAIDIALESFDKIIVIVTSSKVSSTFNNVNIVANSYSSDIVSVIDSTSVVGATKFLLQIANNDLKNGKSFDEIISNLKEQAKKCITYICITNFDALVYNGRISKTKNSIASLLNIKAIISIDYNGVEIESKFRSYTKALKYLSEKVVETYNENFEVFSGHIFNSEMYEKFCTLCPTIKNTQMSIPPIIGIHGGIGLVGVTYIKK